jgi:hypothetical protein
VRLLTLPSRVGSLPTRSAPFTPTSLPAVGLYVVSRILRCELMAVFAVGLAGTVVRPMSHAVMLILTVRAYSDVLQGVVRGITVKMSDLHPFWVSDERGVDKAMNELVRVHMSVPSKVDRMVSLRRNERHQDATTVSESPPTVPHFTIKRSHSSLVTDLVERETKDRPPSLHNDILTGGGLL